MIDMSTTIKRENSLSPVPIVKSEVAAQQKKSTFFSIDQILGRREAQICDGETTTVNESDDVFDKDLSDAESFEDDKMNYNVNIDDDEELTDSEDIVVGDVNNNTEIDNNSNAEEEKDVKDGETKDNKNDKTTPSYTAIIAQAILSSTDKKLPLGCIYDYIAENFPEFLKKGQGWRNCVRHNLSLSECFIKAGRARNGRGNYWGIHPRYVKNFSKGDFRKRRASHRPRNRDLSLMGYGISRYYPYYYNPFTASQGYSKAAPSLISPNSRSGFSVDNILSKGHRARVEQSGPPPISPYKPSWSPRSAPHSRPSTAEGSRKIRLCSPPTLSSVIPTSHAYLEHYNYPHHQPHSHHRTSPYEYGRPSSRTTECSCRSYGCPSNTTHGSSRTVSKH
eukprot:TCONS_00020924-protein